MFKRDFSAQVATEHYYHLDHLGTPQAFPIRLEKLRGGLTVKHLGRSLLIKRLPQ